jgi:hypothetical protein
MANQVTYTLAPHVSGSTWKANTTFNIAEKDITGATITCRFKNTNLVMSTEDNTIVIIDQHRFSFATQIINIGVGTYYGDIDIEFVSGERQTWIKLIWQITENI